MSEHHYHALSLDLSKTTGWAILRNNIIIDSGVQDFTMEYGYGTFAEGARLIKFYEFLQSVTPRPDEIFYEHVQGFQTSQKAVELYFGLLAILKMFATATGIKIIGVHPSTVKKCFAGNGRADKKQMCEKAIELGWKNGMAGTDRNNDEADAIAVMFTVMEQRSKTIYIG
jgi:Holliday junction resolvasome RuvABC endonuclease subunit